MLTLYDVAHFCSWNGYAEDMRGYLGTGKEAWTNSEFWFPHGVNMRHGKEKKTRIQVICEEMWATHDPKNLYLSDMLASYNAVGRVKKLLALGGDPNLADKSGYTPLLICARNGWSGHIPMIKALLDGGADINQRETHGYSALFLAANNGHNEIVKLLLQRGANIEGYTNSGTTALYAAVSGGYLATTKILLSHGAAMPHDIVKDVIQGDGVGTPILQLLYSMGCPKIPLAVQCAVYNAKPLLIRTLIKMGEDPNAGDDFSPLEAAIILDQYDSIIELCKGGADLENGMRRANDTALHYAIARGGLKAAIILCQHGANTKVINNEGDSVLHALILIAHYRGPINMDDFRAILKYIKDFTVVDADGDTPFKVALGYDLNDIAKEIQRAMLRRKGK